MLVVIKKAKKQKTNSFPSCLGKCQHFVGNVGKIETLVGTCIS